MTFVALPYTSLRVPFARRRGAGDWSILAPSTDAELHRLSEEGGAAVAKTTLEGGAIASPVTPGVNSFNLSVAWLRSMEKAGCLEGKYGMTSICINHVWDSMLCDAEESSQSVGVT